MRFRNFAAIVAFGLSLFATWYVTATYKDAVWQSKFDTYKKDLAELHSKNLNEVLNKEREERVRADELEVKYHEKSAELSTIRDDNDRLASELGGLRDPYARLEFPACMGVSTGESPGNSSNKAPTGRLSKEATKFLLDFAEEADRAASYAQTCYRWLNPHSVK